MLTSSDRLGCCAPTFLYPCKRKLYRWKSGLAMGFWLMFITAGLFAQSSVTATPAIPTPGSTPTVTITVPAAGATVTAGATEAAGATLTGTVTVTVSASETGTTIAAVGLQVDGLTLGTATNTSPYTFSVNTATFANGTHSLTATAWDAANNAGNSSPVSVTFLNSDPGNPALYGQMSGTVPLPFVSVHVALLPGARIFMSDGQTCGANAYVWNTATNIIDTVTAPANIFCNGIDQMSDGRLLVAGGHLGSDTGLPIANIFDPSTETWTVLPNMSYPRWYPTANILPNGNILVTSGETNCAGCDVTVQEIYDPSTNSWSQLSSAPFFFPYYPRVFVLSDGRLLVAGTSEDPIVSQVLDLNALTWTAVGGAAVDGGSAVMYLPNEILKMGTSADPSTDSFASAATAYVLDMTQATPTWTPVASMAFPRTYHNSTLLPDGTVLVTGGGLYAYPTFTQGAVLPAELWSPVTQTWTTLASLNAPRLYHSEALLLPDARVLISGGGRSVGCPDAEGTDQLSAEFFSPPYLFKGPRPTITAAPAQLSYGRNFTVQTPNAGQIGRVSLVRFGAVTHAFNVGQRFLPLSFSAGSGSLTVTAPANSNLAPPGNYMLFLVDATGVPSTAATVHFGPPYLSAGPVSPAKNVVTIPNPPDFDGDGKQDLLWRNTSTGQVAVWLMNGSTANAAAVIGSVPLSWVIINTGDFDGNGKSDILWQFANTNQYGVWFMNGTQVVGTQAFTLPSYAGQVCCVADFDGDGLADLVTFNRSTGNIYFWKNTGSLQFVLQTSYAVGAASGWLPIGAARLNGATAAPALIWRNANTGEIAAWFMSSFTWSSVALFGNPGGDVALRGFGDFSGDGIPDLLLFNTFDNVVGYWLLNGAKVPGVVSLAQVSGTWIPVETENLDGTGNAEIIWRQSSTGALGAWQVTGSSFSGYIASIPVDPVWQLQPQGVTP
jgi:hypothetical protein